MTFTASIEDDLLVIGEDDPRTVTLFRRSTTLDLVIENDPPAASGQTITGVHRVMLPTDTMTAAGAILPKSSARFHLQALQLAYLIPQPGDVILDADGRRYSLDSIEESDNGTRYVVTGAAER